MDLNTTIIKNHKKDYEELMDSIQTFMSNPQKEAPSQSVEGQKFYGFSFAMNKSHRFILPVVKSKMMEHGYKDLKWDIYDSRKTVYLYLYI